MSLPTANQVPCRPNPPSVGLPSPEVGPQRHEQRVSSSGTPRWVLAGVTLMLITTMASRPAAASEATSQGSDWLSASSGWIVDANPFWFGGPPTGNWHYDYKHWFDSDPEPAWANFANVEKPAESEWRTYPLYSRAPETLTTTDPHGSTASSDWEVQWAKMPICGNHTAWYYTRSRANAVNRHSEFANSKTQITDPWPFVRPGIGIWSVGGSVAFVGDLIANPPSGSASYDRVYYMALDSDQFSDAQEIMRLHIGALPGDVSLVYDSRSHFARGGTEITGAALVAEISQYYDGSRRWRYPTTDFGPPNVDPDDPLNGYGDAFYFDMFYFIDETVATATLFSEHTTQASGSGADLAVGVGDPPVAMSLELGAGAPNPFRSSTRLTYSLPHAGDVHLSIHDITGRRVRLLKHEIQEAGLHAIAWDGRRASGERAAPGIYMVRLETASGSRVRRIVLGE